MQENTKLGFIGCGNMGGAILKGIIDKGYPKGNIFVYEKNEERAKALKDEYGINLSNNINELTNCSDFIVLAVKPQYAAEALESLTTDISGKILISILAGKKIKGIRVIFNDHTLKVARIMPNTPAFVLEGMSAISFSENVSENEKEYVQSLFESIGKTLVLEEDKMDIVTAISGSGPAYVFAFIEAVIKAGVEEGLSEEEAKLLITQTFLGAAKLVFESNESPKTLRENVSSKGGTTEQGLIALKENAFSEAIIAAIKRAKEKSVLLGK